MDFGVGMMELSKGYGKGKWDELVLMRCKKKGTEKARALSVSFFSMMYQRLVSSNRARMYVACVLFHLLRLVWALFGLSLFVGLSVMSWCTMGDVLQRLPKHQVSSEQYSWLDNLSRCNAQK